MSGNSFRQTVHTHRASVQQAAKLVAALLRVARVTAGLAESNGSLPPGLWLTSPAGWLQSTGISSGTLRSVIEYGLPLPLLTKPVAVNTGLALPRSPWSRYLTFCWAIALADTEKRHVWNSKRTSSLFPPETAHDNLHNGILTHQGACLFAQRVAYIVSRTTRRVRCHYHPAERHYINK